MITADVSWENSWRLLSGAANWDAVWLFAKYRLLNDTVWHHATLNVGGHVIPSGATSSTPTDGKGVFLYRSTAGTGNVNYAGLQIRWNYGADGLGDNDLVEMRLMGVEMVYVPQGSFLVGDGATGVDVYANFEAGASGAPFQITSEASFTLGGGGLGSLGNNNAVNQQTNGNPATGDDFNDGTTQTLPAAFPKGYNSFYIMKYEMTQQQFVDMVNMCSSIQRTRLMQSTHFYPNLGTAQSLRYGITQSYPHTTSEPYVPMIFLDWRRAAAYADWSGLRPMTELEYEKACRGPVVPVINECAWGTANADLSNNLTLNNLSLINEGIASGYDNGGVNGNVWVRAGSQTMTTLGRVGMFAANAGNTGRITSGGSYYGCMEMSGHAWERTVSVGTPEGRKFTGAHGDGALDNLGNANLPLWPGTFGGGVVNTNTGVGYRGGGLSFPTPNLERNARVSNRRVSSSYYNAVIEDDGARFVRTTP